jgi:RNA recognition motif 2
MIKNIPNKYTQKMLIDLLNEHHFGCYDFVYLRMDFKNKCNVGYAFVNLIDPLCIVSFYNKINQRGWKRFSSNKIAQLTYASIQGLENLKKKFRKSSVMQEQESYRPKLFYSEGPLKGYECTEF